MNSNGIESLFDWTWCKRISANKAFEFQTYWCGGFTKWFDLTINASRKCDHAGPELRIELMWFYLCLKIYDVRHWDYDTDNYINEKNMKIIDYIKNMLAREKSIGGSSFTGEPMSDEDFSDDFHHILACIFASAEGWPHDEAGEAQDVENCGVSEVSDSHIIMWAGGDWQEAMTMTLELVDGKLTVTKSEISMDDGFEDLDTRKIFGVPEFE